MDFTIVEHLKSGTPTQRLAYRTLHNHGLLERLAPYQPMWRELSS